MDENKLKELLDGVIAGLTDEQKEQIAACKDNNELIAKLGKMGVALPDELLDDAAGGFIMPQTRVISASPTSTSKTSVTKSANPFSTAARSAKINNQ